MRSKVYLRSFSDYLVENYGEPSMQNISPAAPSANQISMNFTSPENNKMLNSIITPGMSTSDIKVALQRSNFPEYAEVVKAVNNKDAEAIKAAPFTTYFIAQSIIHAMDKSRSKVTTNSKWLDVIADAITSEYKTPKDYMHQFPIDFLDIPSDMVKIKNDRIEARNRKELEDMDREWDNRKTPPFKR